MGDEDGTETGDGKRGKTPEEIAAVTGSDPERIRRAYEAIRIVDEDGNPVDEDGNPTGEDGNPTGESESEEQEPGVHAATGTRRPSRRFSDTSILPIEASSRTTRPGSRP